MAQVSKILPSRRSGLLLPVSTFPGNKDVIGTLGKNRHQVADWLVNAGQKYLQILPLCPPGLANSPFDGPCLLAGNHYFIDLEILADEGDLSRERLADYQEKVRQVLANQNAPDGYPRVDYGFLWNEKRPLLLAAAENFLANPASWRTKASQKFVQDNLESLKSYALFMALKDKFEGQPWYEWPKEFQKPRKNFGMYLPDVQKQAGFYLYLQWQFEKQWQAFRQSLRSTGILVIGDLPAYAALDSADVWAGQELFHLDENGQPLLAAGVPPDYFSKTGQRWGNPIPRWHEIDLKKITEEPLSPKNDYLVFPKSKVFDRVLQMVVQRFQRLLTLVDLVRLDHFRGFAGYGVIPAEDATAERCCWIQGPAEELLHAILAEVEQLPLIAEDLGVITPDVKKLRQNLGLPGMAVFQFAPWADEKKLKKDNYFPPNYQPDQIAYPGTHDNDTLIGWFNGLELPAKMKALAYLKQASKETTPHWAAIDALLKSNAGLTIFPVQDILGLSSSARMNTPATVGPHNWSWRLREDSLTRDLADKFCNLTEQAGRL